MIEGVQLKPQKENMFSETVVASSGLFGRLPIVVAKGLDALFSEQTSNDVENIIVLLKNKLSFARPARQRNKNAIGRLINKISGADPHNIEIEGIILSAILALLDEAANIIINPKKTYLIPLEEVEKIIVRLKKPNKLINTDGKYVCAI